MQFGKQVSTSKRWFLPILSTKSLFQTVLECGNESRRSRNEVISELWCLNILICSKTQEHIFLSKNKWIYIELGHDRLMLHFIFDQRIRLIVDSWIIIFRSRLFDQWWCIQICPHCAWRRGVAWCIPFDLHRAIEMSPCIYLTRRDHEVVDFTQSRVKNNTEFTNLKI